MGYTLSVSMKSIKARDEFKAFLDQHLRPFSKAMSESEHLEAWAKVSLYYSHGCDLDDVRRSLQNTDTSGHISTGDDALWYASGKKTTKLGFDYGGRGPEWEWQRVLLNWLALRGGRLRRLEGMTHGHIDTVLPYMCYDSEAWPVLLESDIAHVTDPKERKKLLWMVTDENGWRSPKSSMQDQIDRGMVDLDTIGESDPGWMEYYEKNVEENRLLGLVTKAEIERLDALWRKR